MDRTITAQDFLLHVYSGHQLAGRKNGIYLWKATKEQFYSYAKLHEMCATIKEFSEKVEKYCINIETLFS